MLRCASSCLTFDEAGCWESPTASTPLQLYSGSVSWAKVSADNRFVAFLTSSTGIGTLMVGPVSGPLVSVGTQVSYDFEFSNDGNWLLFVDSHSNSSNSGSEILKVRSNVTGAVTTLGQGLDITSAPFITLDSTAVFFIDQWSYTAGSGRLQRTTLGTMQTTTVDTGVHHLDPSPAGNAIAWSVNYSRTTSRADLKLAAWPSMFTTTIGTSTPMNSYPQCAFFTPTGNAFIFMDSAVAAGTGLTSGRLRSSTSFGTLNTIGATAVMSGSWCAVPSADGARITYLTSANATARTGTAAWGSTVGGPSRQLGSAVGYSRVSWLSSSSAIAYLDSWVDGFNSDYGTMTYYRAGDANPTSVAQNVYGRFNQPPNALSVIYAANFDFVLERGTLFLLDLMTGTNTQLATNGHEWAEYSPGSDKALYLAEHVASSSTGRLEVVDLPTGANKRVIANGVQDYRYEFTADGSHVFYVANFNGSTGNVTLDEPGGGAAQVLVQSASLMMSNRASPTAAAFTMLTQPGTLHAVRSRDGATAYVDGSNVKTDVWWLSETELLYVKSSGLWRSTITWR